MEIYDLFMAAILVLAVLFGAVKGLAWQLASAAALLGSYVVAIAFHEPVSQHVNAEPPWNKYLAMFLLYLGTSFMVWLSFAFVRRIIDKVQMRDFDRQAGALVGAVNGAAMCLIITFFAVTLPFLTNEQKTSISRSRSGYLMASVVDRIQVGMPEDVNQVIRPYLDRLETELGQHGKHQFSESLVPELGGGSAPKSGHDEDSDNEASGMNPPWNGLDWKRLAEELKQEAGTR